MGDGDEIKTVEVPWGAMADETGLTIAFVRADSTSGELGVHWLPELFSRPIPPLLKKMIVEKLRFHADMLESGEMEERMRRFASINNGQNRSGREQ